jgi:HAMP domain-containing protein
VIVALPSNQVTSSLHHLIVIELSGAVAVLLVLSAGSGLVLRRGLSPLERMADTTKEIAAGDLSQRVQVSSPGTEVGQLAVAFNTMLDVIQAARGTLPKAGSASSSRMPRTSCARRLPRSRASQNFSAWARTARQ